MNNAAFVCVSEGITGLNKYVAETFYGEWSIVQDLLLQIRPFDQVHYDKRNVARCQSKVVHNNQVWMLKSACGFGFLLEAKNVFWFVGEMEMQRFYGKFRPGHNVSGFVDNTHATLAEN
jgi:hypothetical protein